MILELETKSIVDAESFHRAFATLLGFPSFYGGNMDAWIDCMSYLRDPGAAMTAIHLGADEALLIVVQDSNDFRRRVPDLFADFADCTAFTNRRFLELSEKPAIALVLV